MKTNYEQTDNLLGVSELAIVFLFNPYIGVIARYWCPGHQIESLITKVTKFGDSLLGDYEVKSYLPR